MNMAETTTVPAHYNKNLLSELELIASKIHGTLFIKYSNNNRPLKDVAQVNQLINDAHFSQVISCIDDFSKNVLSPPVVAPQIVTITVEKMKNAIHAYLSGYSMLCQRSFPKGYEEGHELVVAVHKRLLEQLLELFEKIIESIGCLRQAINSSVNKTISINIKFNNDEEVTRLTAWIDKVKKQHNEKTAIYSNVDNKSQSWFICVLFFIYSLFCKRPATLNNGEAIQESCDSLQGEDWAEERITLNNEANNQELCTEFKVEYIQEEKKTSVNEAISQELNSEIQGVGGCATEE